MQFAVYISRRHAGKERAWFAVKACLDQLYVVGVRYNELQVATGLDHNDFEDNLQIACALTAKLDGIVTRDPSGFTAGGITIFSPQQMLDKLSINS